MALFRILNVPRLVCSQFLIKNIDKRTLVKAEYFYNQERYIKNFAFKLRVYKFRRKIAGPERSRKRSEWDNWNYKAEIYAFNRRLHENISEETLRRAFIHESYIQLEEQKRKELDIPTQDVPLDLNSNVSLIAQGKKLTSDYLKRYLRYCYPVMPEEGIKAVHDYLLSDQVLSHVSKNLGTKDLIFTAEYPPNEETLASTLLAIIGSVAADDSVSRAENFVKDFICMQLVGKDVFEIWNLNEPHQILNSILHKHEMDEYEPRLIFESGRNTIESIYNVGLYSNKIYLGQAPGETLAIAEELAVYDCLRKLFHIKESEKCISSKHIPELSQINTNPSIDKWFSEKLKLHKSICEL